MILKLIQDMRSFVLQSQKPWGDEARETMSKIRV